MLTARDLNDGEVAGDEEGTTMSVSTSRIDGPKLYRPLGVSAMAAAQQWRTATL